MWENAAQMQIVSLTSIRHIETVHYILVEHDIALLTPTLVACVPASSGQKSPDTTRHALDQHCLVLTDIWSQTCSIRFMSGLWAGQSMTSTSCWSKKDAVSRAVWGGASSWMYTKFRPNTPSPMATFDSSGSGCTDAGSWPHPPRPAHSSPHGGLHPIPWLTGHDFHH